MCGLQVRSKSVADALLARGRPERKETERFVRIMNKFFDLLNVRSTSEGITRRNPDLLPYSSLNNPHLKASDRILRSIYYFT